MLLGWVPGYSPTLGPTKNSVAICPHNWQKGKALYHHPFIWMPCPSLVAIPNEDRPIKKTFPLGCRVETYKGSVLPGTSTDVMKPREPKPESHEGFRGDKESQGCSAHSCLSQTPVMARAPQQEPTDRIRSIESRPFHFISSSLFLPPPRLSKVQVWCLYLLKRHATP